MIEAKIEYSYNGRIAKIGIIGHWSTLVTVAQGAEYGSLTELETPDISWSTFSPSSLDVAEQFGKCFQKGLQIAKRWAKDTGRPHTEISGIRKYHKLIDRVSKRNA